MSNLIEQLGGYYIARAEYKMPVKLLNIDYEQLATELLEYRRANNIFEVWDKVVFDARFCDEHKGSGYGKITYCSMDKRVFEIDSYYLVSIDEIRHATDDDLPPPRLTQA